MKTILIVPISKFVGNYGEELLEVISKTKEFKNTSGGITVKTSTRYTHGSDRLLKAFNMYLGMLAFDGISLIFIDKKL